jgi:hypothetical protein
MDFEFVCNRTCYLLQAFIIFVYILKLNNMKENIKLGLLGLIAILTIVNTAYLVGDDGPVAGRNAVVESTLNSATADKTAINDIVSPEVNNGPKTSVAFAESEHDFGIIDQDTENRKVFVFTNTGTEPLIIENAKGSCGCTVPEYPKEPIAPGETGEINVIYKPGKQKGSQTKTVTITANTEPRNTILNIKANVEEI